MSRISSCSVDVNMKNIFITSSQVFLSDTGNVGNRFNEGDCEMLATNYLRYMYKPV